MKKIFVVIYTLFSLGIAIGQTKIVMYQKNGVSMIPCKVNGYSLDFIFDTGASDVSLSLSEAIYMFSNGLLSDKDIIGKGVYENASGDEYDKYIVNLKEIEIAGLILKDVRASISKKQYAPLLLGQSAIGKLGMLHLDLSKNTLVIDNGNGIYDYSNFYKETQRLIDFKVADSLSETAKKKYELHNYHGAIDDYTAYLKLFPNSIYAYHNRGLSKQNINEYKESLDDYMQAISLNPDSKQTYNNIGTVYEEIREYNNAVIGYTKAIILDSLYETPYYNRGTLYMNMNQYEKAELDLLKSLKINPTNYKSKNNLVFCYNKWGNYQLVIKDTLEAIKLFSKAIKLMPFSKESFFNRARCYNSKLSRKAIDDYSMVLKLDSTFQNAFFNRGIIYFETGNYHSAIIDFNKYLLYSTKSDEALVLRAQCYYGLKKYDLAIRDLSDAINLNGNNSFAFFLRGNIYSDLKNKSDAIKDFSSCIAFESEYRGLSLFSRGIQYYNFGQKKQACSDWHEALKLGLAEAEKLIFENCK